MLRGNLWTTCTLFVPSQLKSRLELWQNCCLQPYLLSWFPSSTDYQQLLQVRPSPLHCFRHGMYVFTKFGVRVTACPTAAQLFPNFGLLQSFQCWHEQNTEHGPSQFEKGKSSPIALLWTTLFWKINFPHFLLLLGVIYLLIFNLLKLVFYVESIMETSIIHLVASYPDRWSSPSDKLSSFCLYFQCINVIVSLILHRMIFLILRFYNLLDKKNQFAYFSWYMLIIRFFPDFTWLILFRDNWVKDNPFWTNKIFNIMPNSLRH